VTTGAPSASRHRAVAAALLCVALAACGGERQQAARPASRAAALDRPITFTTELRPEAPAQPLATTPALPVATTAAAPTTVTTTAPVAGPTSPSSGRTACRAVAHIGDSTSVGMTSAAVLPDPGRRLDAQYARVGVTSSRLEASGGRSVVERLPGQQNGVEVATRLRASGFSGCWVIALGTCDAANVAIGSRVTRAQRVERMMAVIGSDPVLWVDVATRVTRGAWADAQMQLWNADLAAALVRHPNARTYHWTAQVKPSWFTSDGIHYTSSGYASRASLVADALAAAFPG
jgi:hypothetical protein